MLEFVPIYMEIISFFVIQNKKPYRTVVGTIKLKITSVIQMSNMLFSSCFLLLLVLMNSISATDGHLQDLRQETLSKWNSV
jgi:hypothetical protein